MKTELFLGLRAMWSKRAEGLGLLTLDESAPKKRRVKAFRLWMAMESRLHTLDTGMQDRIYSLVLKYAEKKDFPPGGVFAEGNDDFVIPK